MRKGVRDDGCLRSRRRRKERKESELNQSLTLNLAETPFFPSSTNPAASLLPQTVLIFPIAFNTSPLVKAPRTPDPLSAEISDDVRVEERRSRLTEGERG